MAVKVKICGLKTAGAVEAALDAGADYIGLVLFPPSPRNVDLATARRLAEQSRGRARVVVLAVDPDDDLIARAVREVAPDLIQLHGNESVERVRGLRQRHGIGIIKAIKVATRSDAEAALAYAGAAELILFDAKPPKHADRPGGHGATFDWTAIAALKHRIDFMLSGGLDPDNVAEAIRATGAPAVDVSSGVERGLGEKDNELIRRFVAAAKSA